MPTICGKTAQIVKKFNELFTRKHSKILKDGESEEEKLVTHFKMELLSSAIKLIASLAR
ncbi:unnamed protein product [Moneuplotes crassus]|uniref:Uncharacterized protein n=1 Tax=Euplotes crassus TaxID=5936 RepID=A0AAD1XNF9_EUPCR|nr:unnamed protein product [Moneuplotes crassus]